MPARLSKFAIGATCKEYLHPWTDSCASASAGLGLHAVQECLKIYSTLYFITLLTKGRVPNANDMKKTLLSILQSTAFLSWSAFTFPAFVCLFRAMFGHFNIFTVSFVPSFVSSLTAILLERPSRRTMLCLYVSNIATETLFKMAVSRGYARVIPYGEVGIFAAGMSALLYFFKSKENNRDSIFKVIRFGLGPYEEKGYKPRNGSQPAKSTNSNAKKEIDGKRKSSILHIVWEALRVYALMINKIKTLGGKHESCPHPNSCLYDVLGGSLRMFSIGYSIQIGLRMVFQMKSLVRKPSHIKEILFRQRNLNLACFLGGFASLYKLVSCFLRRMNNKDTPDYAIIAGLVASASFVMYPDNTVALYVAWKALQLMWNHGVEMGKVPEVKWFVIFLYCASTAVLFHAGIVEPQNLRLSYWKFLYNLSGGRIAVMSRIPIDRFGLETSKQLQQVLKNSCTTDQLYISF